MTYHRGTLSGMQGGKFRSGFVSGVLESIGADLWGVG